MRGIFLAVLCFLAIILSPEGATVTHGLVLAVHAPFTVDSQNAAVNGGTTQRAVTASGVWTFSPTQNSDGDWNILLNGTVQNPVAAGAALYVLNGGLLYTVTAQGANWFQWNGTAWVSTSDPRAPAGCLPGDICPAGTWSVVLDDEFSGTSVDTTKWTHPPDGGTGKGGDLINNTASLTVSGGFLHISPHASGGGELDSLIGYGPGYYSARLQADPSDWDAFWTLTNIDSNCQPITTAFEADIMENICPTCARTNVIYGGYGACESLNVFNQASATDGFHIWGMLWDAAGGLHFYRDGAPTVTWPGPVTSNLATIILVGVLYNPPPTTTGLVVDWVHYYRPGTAVVTISGINLSNSTFTPNVANGTVGTVSVTMSDGSAFTGGLSITGTNSGRFHLSGTTLQQCNNSGCNGTGGVGTAAGTYTDFNIVATQAGISNSPQQITPTVTGGVGPTPPAAAQAAGFTTLAFNADFTQVGGAFSNPNTYIDCKGAATPVFYTTGAGQGRVDQCGAYTITTDGGVQVLDMQWLNSYTGTGSDNQLFLETPTETSGRPPVPLRLSFPYTAYYEIEYRITPTVSDPGNDPLTAFWSWTAGQSSGSFAEYDYIETYGSNFGSYDAAVHDHTDGFQEQFVWQGTSSLPAGYDPTQYHKYAGRITSTGSSPNVHCAYVDNQRIGSCATIGTSTAFSQRSNVIIDNVKKSETFTNTVDMYIKTIRVWACSGWDAGECYTPTSNP